VIDRALALERDLPGYPERAASALAVALPPAQSAPVAERVLLDVLDGQAKVTSGEIDAAVEVAERLDAEAARRFDPGVRAASLLVRSAIETAAGQNSRAIAYAQEARTFAARAGNAHLRYWSALAHGIASRIRGQHDDALQSLQEALSLADAADDSYRRSTALYQLSVLHRDLKDAPLALSTSLTAYHYAEVAKNPFAMANARMAESAVMELFDRPGRELAAMQEALAIARAARSARAEAKALVNLADIRLRRKQYAEALELSRSALALGQSLHDAALVATSQANLGFATMGLGRLAEGKRHADEAMAEYERTGATAEIAELAGEYGRMLEQLGDYKAALALFHRQRALQDEIALQTRQRVLLEVQEKYESEKRRREIDLLNRENHVKTAELENQAFRQRLWWALAALLAVSFAVVATLYRKLRASSALLARKNADLSILSSRDPLTALYNRRYFQSFLAAEAEAAAQSRRADDAAPRVLLLIDLDHFKETNDRFGHALGDAVLVAVADRLRAALRETDTIVRWGGEEFLVLAKATPDRVDEIAARILRAISAEPIVLNDTTIRAPASIGYAPMPLPPSTEPLSWDRAIGLVDMALYLAKSNGRNRAYGIQRLASDDEPTLAAAERDLEHAWKSGRAELHVIYGPPPREEAGIDTRARRAIPDSRAA
jgi:diguanylate cyclase (GGDEF)-like protein